MLEGADLHEQVAQMFDEVITSYVTDATQGYPEEWDLEGLWTGLKQLYPISLKISVIEDEAGGRQGIDREELIEQLQKDVKRAYAEREAQFGDEAMRDLERRVVLSVLDRKWREHLYEMDYLREGIGLRAYSQRDPLVEYQREGFDMFKIMMDGIREESVGFLFNLDVSAPEEEEEADQAGLVFAGPQGGTEDQGDRPSGPLLVAPGLVDPRRPQNLTYSSPSETGEAHVTGRQPTVTDSDDPYATVGRNELCPCGSGKKFKRCHGAPGGPTGLIAELR